MSPFAAVLFPFSAGVCFVDFLVDYSYVFALCLVFRILIFERIKLHLDLHRSSSDSCQNTAAIPDPAASEWLPAY